MRALPSLLAVLGGCTFYVSGHQDPGADAQATFDAPLESDAPNDSVQPPLGDATIDTPFPPFDGLVFDVVIPPFDAFVPPDIVIPPFDVFPPDAALPDAAMDAGSGWMVIETISVPCSGQVKVSQILTSGVTYRVRASGQCKVDELFGVAILADAEYQGTLLPRDTDNGVDTGIAINDITLGPNKFPTWGNYNSSHVYEISGPGQGAPITLRYHDKANNAYGDNSGALTIEILSH